MPPIHAPQQLSNLYMNIQQQKKLYKKAKNAYYNEDSPIMTDAEFDALEDDIRAQDPSWKELSKVGAPVNKKREVRLSSYMPSLNKVYPAAVDKWIAKQSAGHLIAMLKLDGSSVLATYDGKSGTLISLVTRGNGTLGQDITFLAPHLNLPEPGRSSRPTIKLRLEAIMKKKVFETKWSSSFENPRNMVNGLLNRREPHPALADIDFVVLGRIDYAIRPGLKMYGSASVAFVRKDKSKFTSTYLEEFLKLQKESSDYEIDGLVLMPDTQILSYDNADNPKWAVAFKTNTSLDQALTATVTDIIWQTSRHGRLIPKIRIKPLRIGGVTVKHAAAHNAKWMMDRKIGVGAQVKIVRSGDVIPKIVDVVKTSKFVEPDLPHEWDGVHMILSKAHIEMNEDVQVKKILTFFQRLGIEHIAIKSVRIMYKNGLVRLRSITDYLRLVVQHHEEEDGLADYFLEAGLGQASSRKLAGQLNHLKDVGVPALEMLLASGCFDAGIGVKRLKAIAEAHDLLKLFYDRRYQRTKFQRSVEKVSGFGPATVNLMVEGRDRFHYFWFTELDSAIDQFKVLPYKTEATSTSSNKYQGMVCAWTGYRSKEQEQIVLDGGGIVDGLSKKTTHLFYNPNGKFMAKVEKARQEGVEALIWGEWYK